MHALADVLLVLLAAAALVSATFLLLRLLRKRSLEKLKAEEQLISAMRGATDALVVVLDAEGRLLRSNPACSRVTGKPFEEFLGRPLWDLPFLSFESEQAGEAIRALAAGALPGLVESAWIGEDGKRGLIRWAFAALPDGQGRIERSVGIGVDITQEKLAEADLRRKVEVLGALHDTVMDITAPHRLSELLQTIVERAARLLEATSGGLYLCDPERREARCVASYNTPRDYSGTVLRYGEGAAGIVAQSGKPLVIDDYRTWPGRAAVYEEEQPFYSVASAPMIWHGQVTGVIHVLHRRPELRFDQDDLALLTLFANQAAIAVENARLVERAQLQARQAETLRQAGSAVAASLNQDEAIHSALAELQRLVPYDTATLQLLQGGGLEIVGARGWKDPQRVIGLLLPVPGENPASTVILQRQPCTLADAPSAYAQFRAEPFDHVRSWLGVPLIVRDRVTGILALDSARPHFYTAEHSRLVGAFADQAAIALENTRLYALERQRVQELDALRATVADISSELELTRLLKAILERATLLLKATGGDLGLYDEARRELLIVVSYNMGKDYTGTRMALGEGAMGRVAESRQPLIIDDYAHWEGRSPQYASGPWQAVLAAPLIIGNRLVGVIGIVDSSPNRRFSSSDERLLNLFAQQSAIAVENSRLYEEVRRLAVTDPLTGLYNRRGLFQLGQREIDRVRRFGHPLSAIMLDIDHFKRINDTYSHAIGDQVLRVLADRCRISLRDVDIVGRYGGEEFAILLPETDSPSAYVVAERLREQVAKIAVPTERGPIPITISLGVTEASREVALLEALFDQADAAMYAAKEGGRNQVVVR